MPSASRLPARSHCPATRTCGSRSSAGSTSRLCCWGSLSIALALLYIRRPSRRAAALTAALVVLAAAPPAAAASRPDPLFAYYYIWFNAGSWNRAKIDYPLLGRYSSDDRGVMEQHVDWAKQAGIDGFIVSWKSTPVLNRRLERLIEVADAKHFRLLVIYQGLDFHREPLPASRVGADLDFFINRFAGDRAFEVFDKPVVIWSGTPKFSRADVAGVTGPRRDALRILASERNVKGYRRVAALVDGNAYYWASVNPRTYPGQAEKLTRMGDAIHARRGIWIPSAAPGFDAREVGGTSVVERDGGATLRAELDAAATSSPDAIGLISWNEFSENTHVEPSRRARIALSPARGRCPRREAAGAARLRLQRAGGHGRQLRRAAARRTGAVHRGRRGAPHPSTVGKPPIGGLWAQRGRRRLELPWSRGHSPWRLGWLRPSLLRPQPIP